jgi:hypothetical protein
VPLSDIGECLKEENFYSLKEGQARIFAFAAHGGVRRVPAPCLVAQWERQVRLVGRLENSSPPAGS